MARFRVVVHTRVPAPVAWHRLVSAQRHTSSVPLTVVTVHDSRGLTATSFAAPGAQISALTRLGPWRLADTMAVDHAQPATHSSAGEVRLHKTGAALTGSVRARVVPAPDGATVVWDQEIGIPALRWLPQWLIAAVAKVAYDAALRGSLSRD